MNSESRLILEVWESVRDFVPTAKRTDIAQALLRSFEEFGTDPGLFADLRGEDKNLEEAFETLYGEDEEAAYLDYESDDDIDPNE